MEAVLRSLVGVILYACACSTSPDDGKRMKPRLYAPGCLQPITCGTCHAGAFAFGPTTFWCVLALLPSSTRLALANIPRRHRSGRAEGLALLQAASPHLPHCEEATHHKWSLLGFMVLHHLGAFWIPEWSYHAELCSYCVLLACLVPNALFPACHIHVCPFCCMPYESINVLCINRLPPSAGVIVTIFGSIGGLRGKMSRQATDAM